MIVGGGGAHLARPAPLSLGRSRTRGLRSSALVLPYQHTSGSAPPLQLVPCCLTPLPPFPLHESCQALETHPAPATMLGEPAYTDVECDDSASARSSTPLCPSPEDAVHGMGGLYTWDELRSVTGTLLALLRQGEYDIHRVQCAGTEALAAVATARVHLVECTAEW